FYNSHGIDIETEKQLKRLENNTNIHNNEKSQENVFPENYIKSRNTPFKKYIRIKINKLTQNQIDKLNAELKNNKSISTTENSKDCEIYEKLPEISNFTNGTDMGNMKNCDRSEQLQEIPTFSNEDISKEVLAKNKKVKGKTTSQ
uniref:Uncharacterized protein n=1 Tax=Megaselia scalaris TaxID=36166 RepID=T1GDQ3_MEGSC